MNQTKNTPLVISSRRAREKKVPLIGSSQSNIRNRTNQSPRRSSVRVRQTNNGCGQAYFFLPSPSPSPILNPSTSPLKSVFDSSQLSGSINVQDGGTTLFLKTIHGSRSKIRLLLLYTSIEVFPVFWGMIMSMTQRKIKYPGIKLNHNNNDIQLCIVIIYTTVFLLVLKEILKFYSRTLFDSTTILLLF